MTERERVEVRLGMWRVDEEERRVARDLGGQPRCQVLAPHDMELVEPCELRPRCALPAGHEPEHHFTRVSDAAVNWPSVPSRRKRAARVVWPLAVWALLIVSVWLAAYGAWALIEDVALAREVYRGSATAYSSCDSGSVSASGQRTRDGIVASNTLPLGTVIKMRRPRTVNTGFTHYRRFFRVLDRGGPGFLIDIFMSCGRVYDWGRRSVAFEVVSRPGGHR